MDGLGAIAQQLAYLAAFGLGTIAGMLAVTMVLGLVIRFATRRGAEWATLMHVAAAAATVSAGLVLVARAVDKW